MPRKKDSSKSSVNRYSSAPAAAKASKAKEVPAKSEQTKLPTAGAAGISSTTVVSPIESSAKSPTTSTASSLIGALRQSDADIARDAATSLGALGDSAAVEPLIEVLNNTDGYYHAVVRAAAAASLGKLGDRRAVEPLLSAVRDSLAEPSAEAIRALAAIGDARAVSPLIDVVRNTNGFFLPIARRAAVVALASFKSDEQAAAEVLAVSTDGWEDPVIRQAAIDAIGSSAKDRAAE
jgi:HEAT repeat protein